MYIDLCSNFDSLQDDNEHPSVSEAKTVVELSVSKALFGLFAMFKRHVSYRKQDRLLELRA